VRSFGCEFAPYRGWPSQQASQEAIKQVAIGHRVSQSMPQSFTERKQMALRARRFDQCICHQREATKMLAFSL